METIAQPPEREAGRPPAAQPGGLAARPSRALSCCCAWPGPARDAEARLLLGALQARSPFPCQEASTAGTRAPIPAAAFSSLCLLKIASPGAQLVGSGRRPGTPGSGQRAGPGFPRSVCSPGLARALLPGPGPARPAGPPFCRGSRRFWGRKTETSPVFSRLPGF